MTDFNKVNVDRSLVSAGGMGNSSVNVIDLASIGLLAFDGPSVFYVTKIPKGSIINGLKLNAEAGLGEASSTMDIGYIMGETTVADYFVDGFDIATGGESSSAAFPLECTDDCYIIATPLVADTVADKRMTVVTGYEFKGEV